MTGDLATPVRNLLRSVRAGRGAVLMDLEGVPIEQATSDAGTTMESLAAEYAGLLRQAQSLATELEWGAPRSYSVRGAASLVVCGFLPGELALAVEAGPPASRGQVRQALADAMRQLGDL